MTGTAFYPLGDQISFFDQRELINKILSIDFNQGSKEKTSDFRERYTLFQYLLTLASRSFLIYPFKIVKGETPDFIWLRGDLEFGVEVTEGTTQKLTGKGSLITAKRDRGSLSATLISVQPETSG